MTISAYIALFIIAALVFSPIVYTAYIIWKTPGLEDED